MIPLTSRVAIGTVMKSWPYPGRRAKTHSYRERREIWVSSVSAWYGCQQSFSVCVTKSPQNMTSKLETGRWLKISQFEEAWRQGSESVPWREAACGKDARRHPGGAHCVGRPESQAEAWQQCILLLWDQRHPYDTEIHSCPMSSHPFHL